MNTKHAELSLLFISHLEIRNILLCKQDFDKETYVPVLSFFYGGPLWNKILIDIIVYM